MSAVGNANSLRFSALMKPFSSNRNLIKEIFLPTFTNNFQTNRQKLAEENIKISSVGVILPFSEP